ncbi:hypothetical protein JIG36_07470 [Actinoplanes sp. LDG1-06]|uniref:KAP NTPase domain-containing protein n=1 Tax=Paractinoplanes ovalisporus TaxID=2810368 RepID=A0ABS2A6C3_9ACTN|nr:P-loop NTPase fold protein [Actinoplanes ovalisporus]MBM2615402.1 hypothetical protein [Actinoplanes ovalisporus]
MTDLHDLALTRPEDDLLGMRPYAGWLARQLRQHRLPLTVGIYGSWGEGKTTFAHFLKHYLLEQEGWSDARFVTFSAWPYVTADAIWRALLEEIARKIYVSEDHTALVEPPESVRARLRGLLLGEVFAGPSTTTATSDKDAFENLMRRVGRHSRIANRAAGDAQTARQVSLLAGFVGDLLSMFAGPMGSIRRLVGLGSDSFGTPGLAPQTAPAAASMEETRDGIKHLFARAQGRKTIVLVDDLDRCLPEVALDVLETIKIVFSEGDAAKAECLFLVAADEEILSRGLRQRLGSDEEAPARDAEARAYLEKVIQLGVPIAKVRSEPLDRLIGKSFPEWSGAMDLLAAGAGGNPRRLKQQCYLLSYGYDVGVPR